MLYRVKNKCWKLGYNEVKKVVNYKSYMWLLLLKIIVSNYIIFLVFEILVKEEVDGVWVFIMGRGFIGVFDYFI